MHPKSFDVYAYCAEHGEWRSGSTPAPEHLEIIREFVADVYQAQAEWENECLERVRTAAVERSEKTGLLDWRASSWLLENGDSRGAYHRHMPERVVKVVDKDGVDKLSMHDKTDAEIIALAGGEWHELLGPSPESEADAAHPG